MSEEKPKKNIFFKRKERPMREKNQKKFFFKVRSGR